YSTQSTLSLHDALPIFFDHNATDILSLAFLTAIVPFAFRTDEGRPLGHGLRHGADLVGLGRWMLQAERPEESRSLLKRAVELGRSEEQTSEHESPYELV